MLLVMLAIAALAFWDEQRESSATLDEFAEEQVRLAGAVAAELATRLSASRLDPPSHRESARELLVGERGLERPGAVRLLVALPASEGFGAADGQVFPAPEIARAFAESRASLWLTRDQASALGLPPRRAAAGLAQVEVDALGRLRVAVVSSAERLRDREMRARWRLILGVLLAGGLVLAFGSAALIEQRRELLLERELAMAALGRERDARLSTASRAATMGTLAMGVAHEVSTPLGVIAGRAEQLLPRVAGDERSARAVEAIVEQSERIRRVVRSFLDLARGGAPVFGPARPEQIVAEACALVEHRFAQAEVTLRASVPEGLPPIPCDLPLLRQALVNLLLNACDACDPGGEVALSLRAEGAKVEIVVRDDGVGISAEAAARALEPFFTTKARGEGSGLGLAITHEIVKMHHGSLDIAPAEGRGTRAVIRLPGPPADERRESLASA
jgi:signal transduction histidine kinase